MHIRRTLKELDPLIKKSSEKIRLSVESVGKGIRLHDRDRYDIIQRPDFVTNRSFLTAKIQDTMQKQKEDELLRQHVNRQQWSNNLKIV